jgi:hypothetical protein
MSLGTIKQDLWFKREMSLSGIGLDVVNLFTACTKDWRLVCRTTACTMSPKTIGDQKELRYGDLTF